MNRKPYLVFSVLEVTYGSSFLLSSGKTGGQETKDRMRLAFEIKASLTPHLSKGFPDTIKAIKPDKTWIVCPKKDPSYPLRNGVRVTGINECLKELEAYL